MYKYSNLPTQERGQFLLVPEVEQLPGGRWIAGAVDGTIYVGCLDKVCNDLTSNIP